MTSSSIWIAKARKVASEQDTLLAPRPLASRYPLNGAQVAEPPRLCLLRFAVKGTHRLAPTDRSYGNEHKPLPITRLADKETIKTETQLQDRAIHLIEIGCLGLHGISFPGEIK